MKKSKGKLPALRTLCVVFVALLLTMPARPQTPPEKPAPVFSPELAGRLRSIRDTVLGSDYAWQQLAHLTENIGPRPAGSPSAQAAAEYVAAEMKKLGLEVRLEPAQVSHWVRGEEKAELTEYPGQPPST